MFPRFLIALAVCFASAVPLRASDADVAQLLVSKAVVLIQLGPGDPVLEPQPFAFYAEADATNKGTILSGTVGLAGGPVFNLEPSDATTLNFVHKFDALADLNAAFPDNTYFFNLHTLNPPDFVASVTYGPQFASVIPQLVNAPWYSDVVQVDVRQPFNFMWNEFSDPQVDAQHPKGVEFQVTDVFNNTILDQELDPSATGIAFSGDGATPGLYIGRLMFAHGDQSQSSFTTAFSLVMTEFLISLVDGPPVITSPTTVTVNAGQLFIYNVEATNGAGDFVANNLPAGVKYNANRGFIGGKPMTPGNFPIDMIASNSIGSGHATLMLHVLPASGVTITSSTRAAGGVGDPFRFQVLAPGASSAAEVTATGLPPGLKINSTTGLISGVPTQAGKFAVNLHVSDGAAAADGILLVRLDADPAFPGIRSATTATLTPGQDFSYQIQTAPETATGAVATNATDDTTYALIGELPPGLFFDDKSGTISGKYQGAAQRLSDSTSSRLSGGAVVGNVQLFASNSRGTASVPLVFFNSPAGAVNISTRLAIAGGDNVLIGGFIVTGNAPKKLIVRALGASLPVPGALQDPVLEIHGSDGSLLLINDNWQNDDAQSIIDTGIAPNDGREAAIVGAFQPNVNYTAIVSGKDGASGVALVELYDLGTAALDASSTAKLANISTRGLVQTDDNVMIGGFIISQVQSKVIVRAIGPSLTQAGVTGALQDTTLELHGADGQVVASNDDWQSEQAQQISDTGIPPTDSRESAVLATLNPGNYTAVVRGKNNTTGVALVEVYALQ